MRVSVVANGVDDIIDLVNNFWGVELPTRVAPLLQQRGYQVLSNEVTSSVDVWAAIGNTYPYQIRLTLETGVSASSSTAIQELIRSVLLAATGYTPDAIAITSAGQPPPAPPESAIDRTIGAAGNLVEETVFGARALQLAIVIGAIVVVIWIAKNPARTARVFA